MPAREVGGDYYDFFAVGERRIGVLIADVSGKGTSAALYMAELKGLMLSLSQIYQSPRQLLIEVNRIISENLDTRSFITMTYAVIDLDAGVMTFARAGHTPLIYVPSGEPAAAAQVLAPNGLVVGLRIPGAHEKFIELLEEDRIELRKGDVLVFYTDGITEAMNADSDLFGDARLGRLLAEHGHLDAADLRERILREIESFVGARRPARRHDDDPDQGRNEAFAAVRRGGGMSGTRRHLPHAVGDRGQRRPRAARDARHPVGDPERQLATAFPLALNDQAWERRVAVNPEHARAGAAHHRQPPRRGAGRRASSRSASELEPLERRIGYRFKDRGMLEHALTHRSRVHEDASGGVFDNESMEFLGDSVLGFVIAAMLFREFPQHNEGQKSKLKASLVSAASLARLAEQIDLGEFLILGRGEEKTGGRRKHAIIADCYEALIAAIYLDGGIEPAQRVHRAAVRGADRRGTQAPARRPASPTTGSRRCRSICRRGGRGLPAYRLAGEVGPDHRKSFVVEVVVDGEAIATAEGRSKKEAAQAAARAALERLTA